MVHRASTINNENTVHSFNTFGANEVQQIIATSAQRSPESNFRHQDKGSTVWTGEDKVEIEVCSDKPEDEYEERSKFEERYYALMAQARNLLCRDGAADDGRSVAGSICKQAGESFQHNFIRLPKIDLPRFHGSYQCWLEYRDTFLSLIHSSASIDNISKFHYLRASLSGAALDIITNIDFKGDNYLMAWQLLCDRYDNSRLLVHNHVQALFNVEQVVKESSLCLRRLLDTINKNIRALKTLNEPTQYWDTLLW
ncbi:uncharacterized protein LOC123721909 [Papilio machaon]|uniref:uncharacterized protein LOC123721909 n=1 Tax=Papilio machaon TaxID=76193 RepID=UPI001E664DE0|nr:uncharacterized protein LOC123721909 [Papilio machaon]